MFRPLPRCFGLVIPLQAASGQPHAQSQEMRLGVYGGGEAARDLVRPVYAYHGRQAALRGLRKPDGLHPGREFPPSMLAGEQYLDPLRTYVVEVGSRGSRDDSHTGQREKGTCWAGGGGNVLDSEPSDSHRGVSKSKQNLAEKSKPCGDTGKASTV